METNSKRKPLNLIYLFLGLIFLSCSPENDKIETLFGEEGNSQKEENKNGSLTYNGYTYKTVVIGDQEWLAENLRTMKYNDGTPISNLTNKSDWHTSASGAFCVYENNMDNFETGGYLYNWYAAGSGKLAPQGWRVATDEDWGDLETEVGGPATAGQQLKSKVGWSSAGNGDDSFGFSIIPAGTRDSNEEDFNNKGNNAGFWTLTGKDESTAWCRYIFSAAPYSDRRYVEKTDGFSIRLVRNLNNQINNPPVEPSNPSPASNLTTLQPTTVSLSWSCSDPDGDSLTYDVYFGTNSSPTSIVSANQTTKNFTPTGLTNNTTYYWKIVAKDSRGGTTNGPVWQFKTELPPNNPPVAPSNPSPASNLTTLQPTTVSLNWSCSDPDGDALTYDVYFGTSSTPTTIVSANQTAKTFTPTGLTNNTIYYWKIVTKDSRGESTTGVVWNFKTELSPNNPPVTPSNPSPASNLTTLQPTTVSLSWSCSDPDGDTLTYDVYFGTNSSPTTIVSANQTTKTFTPTGLTTNTIYYWKIVAKDSRGGSTDGLVWQFKSISSYDFTFDGHLYKTVVIGTQVWTVENLQTTKYNDGSAIPDDSSYPWVLLKTGAYCIYGDEFLYNYFAVNSGKLAPSSWRIPSETDWTILIEFLGGESIAGKKLKAKSGWNYSGNGTDDFGFNAQPTGLRNDGGYFWDLGSRCYWWQFSGTNSNWQSCLVATYSNESIHREEKQSISGLSVRLVRDK